jgi:6-phosphofructokinase
MSYISLRIVWVFRLFGRDAGFTAVETANVIWADRLLIPEVPSTLTSWPS